MGLGCVINQSPHALAPQCGWMRDKADSAVRSQPEGKASQATHCVVALRLCSQATRHSGRLALHGLAGFRVGGLIDDTP